MSILVTLLIWSIIGFAGWRVFTRAGFKGQFGLFFLVPVMNFIALILLAYKPWPIDKKSK
ncbi:hypothetical protein [Thalassotalea aquiviva]|uniref:hypothetical protein n=1 Tax=Thalassotalea aquiviva TaxID=3242415 RepID=UPI003529F2CA